MSLFDADLLRQICVGASNIEHISHANEGMASDANRELCTSEWKHLLRYLRRTQNLGLFYQSKSNVSLIGYEDGRYLSYPQKVKSQFKYLFTYGSIAIS